MKPEDAEVDDVLESCDQFGFQRDLHVRTSPHWRAPTPNEKNKFAS